MGRGRTPTLAEAVGAVIWYAGHDADQRTDPGAGDGRVPGVAVGSVYCAVAGRRLVAEVLTGPGRCAFVDITPTGDDCDTGAMRRVGNARTTTVPSVWSTATTTSSRSMDGTMTLVPGECGPPRQRRRRPRRN
jgi:hypothetical protein